MQYALYTKQVHALLHQVITRLQNKKETKKRKSFEKEGTWTCGCAGRLSPAPCMQLRDIRLHATILI